MSTDEHNPFSPIRGDTRGRPPEVCEVLPNLLVGEYPRAEDIEWLKRGLAVSAVFSLQDNDDLASKGLSLARLLDGYREHAIEFRRMPVADNDTEALSAALPRAVEELDRLIAAGHRVLLHCNAGYNRAPTVAIAYLHVRHSMALDEARDFLKARRACVPFMTLLRRHFGEL
jgi:atypical dual specificity phosphatase